jgi:hypothetical protein
MLWRIPADTHEEVRQHGSSKPPASSNLNGDNGTVRPDSADVAEAVALMPDAGEAGGDEAGETASADEDEGDDAPPEGDGKGSRQPKKRPTRKRKPRRRTPRRRNSGAPTTRPLGIPSRPS